VFTKEAVEANEADTVLCTNDAVAVNEADTAFKI